MAREATRWCVGLLLFCDAPPNSCHHHHHHHSSEATTSSGSRWGCIHGHKPARHAAAQQPQAVTHAYQAGPGEWGVGDRAAPIDCSRTNLFVCYCHSPQGRPYLFEAAAVQASADKAYMKAVEKAKASLAAAEGKTGDDDDAGSRRRRTRSGGVGGGAGSGAGSKRNDADDGGADGDDDDDYIEDWQ